MEQTNETIARMNQQLADYQQYSGTFTNNKPLTASSSATEATTQLRSEIDALRQQLIQQEQSQAITNREAKDTSNIPQKPSI